LIKFSFVGIGVKILNVIRDNFKNVSCSSAYIHWSYFSKSFNISSKTLFVNGV